MKIDYEIRFFEGKSCAYLPDVPQYLDAADLWQWMKELRDTDTDLYAEMLHAYTLITKHSPATDTRNTVRLSWRAKVFENR